MLIKPCPKRLLEERLDAHLRYRDLLPPGGEVQQQVVDRALRLLHAGEPGDLTRSATEQLVLERLGNAESSATELAERWASSAPRTCRFSWATRRTRAREAARPRLSGR